MLVQTGFLATRAILQQKVVALRLHILAVSLVLLTSALLLLASDQVVAGGSMVEGTVYVRNYMRDFRATGWANVTATDGVRAVRATITSDGRYRMYLGTGSWELITSVPGYETVSEVIAVPDGGTVTKNFYLEQSGVPIPEFHEYATPLITSISLLLVVLLMRRRTSLSPRLK